MPQTLRLPRRCAPRNDANLERFYLENRRFLFFCGRFLRGIAPHRLSNVHSGNRSVFNRFVPEIAPFSRKTHQICHCEEGACARRGSL